MLVSARNIFVLQYVLSSILFACCVASASDSLEIESQKEIVVVDGEAGTLTERGPSSRAPRRNNCVDACVLELLLRSGGISVSDAEFDAGLVELDLDPSAAFRSLADCLDMLAFFGMDVATLRFRVAEDAAYPPVGIVYLPPAQAGKVGHVVIVEDADNDRIAVWDPGSRDVERVMRRDEISFPLETVVIVPRTHLRQKYIRTFVISLIVAGLVILWPVRHRLKRAFWRPTSITAFFLLVLPVGCTEMAHKGSGASAELVVISPTAFDFGVLDPETCGEQAAKTFTVSNRGSRPILCRLLPDCSCIVTNPAADAFEVQPGAKAEFTLRVSLNRKAGNFDQNIAVSIAESDNRDNLGSEYTETPSKLSPQIIHLTGFVQRHPLPVRDSVRLRALDGKTTSGTVHITHGRSTDMPSLSIVDMQLLPAEISPANSANLSRDTALPTLAAKKHAGSEKPADSSLSSFEVGKPRFIPGIATGPTCVDSWQIPIKFTAIRGDQAVDDVLIKRTLRVAWGNTTQPNVETRCDLIGQLMPPIEMPANFLAGETTTGLELKTAVPIRFNTSDRLNEYEFLCPPQVRVQLDEASLSLIAWIAAEEAGDFNHRVSVMLDNTEVASVVLVGRVTGKRAVARGKHVIPDPLTIKVQGG
jgi:hypothetical protein